MHAQGFSFWIEGFYLGIKEFLAVSRMRRGVSFIVSGEELEKEMQH